MTRRRLVLYLLMLGVLLKHLLSGEYGLFDRFLEIGVFLLILYEIISPHTLIRRAKRRNKLRRITATLRTLSVTGESIRQKVQTWRTDVDPEWMESVQAWIAEVEAYLASQSSDRALIEFRHISLLDTTTQRNVMTEDGSIWHVSGAMGDRLQQLGIRMNNLHRLIQETDAYF